MSEFKSRIVLGGVVAVILGLSLGLGLTYLPNSFHASSTESSTTITVASTTSFSTASGTMSSSTATTVSSSSVSSTTESPVLITNKTIQINPSLNVTLAQSALLDTNATIIAQRFAGALNQSLAGAANVTPSYQSQYYSFETNAGSTIIVSFGTNIVQVTYRAQNWDMTGNATTVNPDFSILAANRYATTVMNSIGIGDSMNLTNTSPSFSPNDYLIQWVQSYEGIPFLGPLTENPDGSYFFSSTQAYFDFNPDAANGTTTSAGTLKQAIFVNPYWYIIPSTFPLKINPDNASAMAENYAIHDLGMTFVSSIQINFATVQNHLYYLVTVLGYGPGYEIFVDPSNGQVGFPE